ncbi:Pyrophosphate--fructose 6-phosphate 1-phosphotransferase subunit beta 2 [Dichanthelium oligosanthes]|uniref:Pyrophosphate--fructose 6-phosphate 1-phosphotransferase subunit beta 2 n=1 Tax=Dichanthelium oligosanthes TaxID=888268 RepID=A0A1E5UL35_9POAL|nr:Pyrophosphate--fructose 6-phosphate 1-phosphotransferase subunit beta 2 [Dichanthelium oligosanthes]
MAAAAVTSNGGAAAANGPAPGRLTSVYSEVQTSRLVHELPLPSVLRSNFSVEMCIRDRAGSCTSCPSPPSSAPTSPSSTGPPAPPRATPVSDRTPPPRHEIAKLFPNLFGQPSALVVPSAEPAATRPLKIGVVLSGGQAPGGHNVICGIFDYLQERAKGSTMYGFKGGPAGIMKCKYVELTSDYVYPYRNQGGFDMICSGRDKIETPEQYSANVSLDFKAFTTMAMVHFLFLQFKIYSEMIGNVMTDARSTGKYYHFVRLMGRAASHITLECALQTHPNAALIGEEEQLLLERDPHGNVQVAKIETEKMLIAMVETELEKRKAEGRYRASFRGQSHFFGYEGRCGLPTNFDSSYCYALGYGSGTLLQSGKTGLITSVANLAAPVEEWTVGGTALTSLMDVERRHGKYKPVIKKAMVELDGAPFKKFASMRDEWGIKNRYISPGPIQFSGPGSDDSNHTLMLELGAQA